MTADARRGDTAGGHAAALAQVQALRRIALAVAHPGGPNLFPDLARELAGSLQVALVFIAVFADDSRTQMRTLAACLDGRILRNFDYQLEGSPCADVVGRSCRFIASGLLPLLAPGSMSASKRMDSFAAYPLSDSAAQPLGLVAAMDRQPIAGGDADHAEAMLKIVAGRVAAQIERERTDEALRAVALAVSGSRSATVFDELVRLLAAILHVEVAFIARYESAQPEMLRIVAMVHDGQLVQDVSYRVAGTPCETVLGQRFRAYPSDVQSRFPADEDLRAQCAMSYAGHPLVALDGSPLGIVSVASRRPMAQLDRVEAMLKIFAVRAAAEVERLLAGEAQKRAVEDLRLREEQYRAIFEGSLDGLFMWDENLRIVDVNPAGLALYGYQREEVIGRTFPSSMPQDYVKERLELVRRAMAGETVHIETTVLRPDGTTFDADLRIMPFVQRGHPHALTVLRDISERRRRERALRASEEQYRAIFNASADALVLRAADFSIVDVNATYEAMSGYTRAEVLGVDRILANPPEVMATIRALHERALAGEAISLDTRMLRRDGHCYELELRGVPIEHRGQPHVLYIGRDITQAKRAERALRDSEEQYRAIFNASADALVLRDANYRAVEVNPAYTTMSGYTREEVMNADHVLTQADGALRARHRTEHELALAGRELRFEVTSTRKDGSVLQAEVRGTPMMYRGRPHVLYAARDITDRNAAEQRRRELERQLRQAQKMEAIGQLTGGLAHDFNNILTSVLGYVSMALERPAVGADPVLARQLGQARLAAERARDHVAQLLAFSRPRRGERRLVAAATMACQALQLLRPNLPSSIAVEAAQLCAEPDLVPPVVADPVQLEQVLFNLCINARDAIHDHGTIRVRIGHSTAAGHCASCSVALDDSPWVWVEVADDGRGMSREVIERMFEPFFTTKEVGRGTGMGLAMVHGIVHDHEGHIQVVSRPGEGSVFRVLLPPAAQDTPHGRPAAAAAPAEPPSAPPLRGRVLLVEDEAIVSDYMLDAMAAWGLEVVLERDPLAAVRRLSSPDERFDLVLTDQTMPGMTGLALARHAARCRPALPVLLYTGNASEIGQKELAECGVTALLRKPIDAGALRSLLRELLLPVAVSAK